MDQQINLVDLDFDKLKQNLVSYLKTTSVGQQFDLDSQGTAVDMILRLFSYNNLIWMHYLHVLSNESFISTAKNLESISKLLQTSGFTPPTKKSSLALITFTKSNSNNLAQIDRFATFEGTSQNNTKIYFYHIGPKTTIDLSSTLEFYGGTSLIKEVAISVDLDKQEYKIPDKDVDFRTVLISVNGRYWTNNTLNQIKGTNEDSEVFFVVKSGEHYYVKFGKDVTSQDINSIGKSVISTDSVKISYVVASGEEGNNITFTSIDDFKSNNTLSIPDVSVSSVSSYGGFDEPDIDYLKYIGTRYYSNTALVTKSDYEAEIANSSYVSTYTDIANSISVFDGEDYNNNYGTVYYSIIDLDANSTQIESLSSTLKNKSISGINITYLEPDIFTGSIEISVSYDSSKTDISSGILKTELINELEADYGTSKFNNSLSKSDIAYHIMTKNPALSVQLSDITVTVNKEVDFDSSRIIRFYNGISSFTTDLVTTSLSGSQVKFKNTSTSVPGLNGYKYIGAYNSSDTLVKSKVGVFNPTNGDIIFYSTFTASSTFTLTLTASSQTITPKNNMAISYEVDSLTVT